MCVESVFAAQKAKAINDANIISMGSMIVGESMACAMADAWLDANFADGFEELRGFLETAREKVSEIDGANRAETARGK